MKQVVTGSVFEDQSACPFGPELQKYWDKRHEYFNRFDDGIQIDKEGLYSVTPEKIAQDIALRFRGAFVLDGFAGTGSNAIAFAQHAKRVVSVELDAERLQIAKHNAVVYGVSKRIDFIHGDIMNVMSSIDADAAFLDPPWGGPSYAQQDSFLLEHFNPHGNELLQASFNAIPAVALKVPRNFRTEELLGLDRRFSISKEEMDNKHVFSTVHFHPPQI